MSTSHHGNNDENARRFMEQVTGTSRREYPAGRMGADDDGALAYAMATNDKTRTIIMRFPSPTEWIGLDVQAATELRDELDRRILALRIGSAT